MEGIPPPDLLLSLDDDVWKEIFFFVSNAKDFVQCGRSCRRFYFLLFEDNISEDSTQDNNKNSTKMDGLWAYCPGAWREGLELQRERASVHVILDLIRHEQRIATNIFVDVFGVNQLKGFLLESQIRDLRGPTRLVINKIRGDSLAALAHVMQHCVVSLLQNMLLMCIHRSYNHDEDNPQRKYPKLNYADFQLAAQVAGVYGMRRPTAPAGATRTQLHKVIRRMASRSGVVFLDDRVYEGLMNFIMLYRDRIMCHLWTLGDTRHTSYHTPNYEGTDPMTIDIHNFVPPVSIQQISPGGYQYVCTIVPRQVKEAASSLNFHPVPNMYEDDAWLPEEGNLIEEEISVARMQYLHKPFETHPSADTDSGTNEEEISEEDISEEDTSESDSIMSVYSDADCPDYED